MECFGSAPTNIMTDECPSFAAAIESKLINTEHFISGGIKEIQLKET